LSGRVQISLAKWWAAWHLVVLRGTFVHLPTLRAASTRAEVVAALRARDPAGELLPEPPYRVRVMTIVLEDTVTLWHGGPRYLHAEREKAIYRAQVFIKERLPLYDDAFVLELSDQRIMYIRLGQHGIERLDTRRPVPTDSARQLLVRHPRLPLKRVDIDARQVSVDYMLEQFARYGRSMHEGIFEWARLNPLRVDQFFEVCLRDADVSKKFRPIYEQLRMIAVRVLNIHPREIPICEDNLARYQDLALRSNAAERAELAVKRAEIEAEDAALEEESRHIEWAIGQGKRIDRSQFRGPAQPAPRPPAADLEHRRPLRERLGFRQLNQIELHRRGQHPDVRALEFGAIRRVVFPDRGVPVEGEQYHWEDGNEDPTYGRAFSQVTEVEVRLVRLVE
jgi:hypothetical protein